MVEQKADKAIRKMEKEQLKLGKLMGVKGDNTQRIKKGGWV
jgi:hypothetical protein